MNTKILILLALAAVAAADSREFRSYGAPHRSSESFESSDAQYNFKWDVQHEDSGNNYGQEEARDHDDTQGVYYVSLPDGRLQTVNYNVQGRSGFVPEINYDGEARYPDFSHSVESFEFVPSRPRPRPAVSTGAFKPRTTFPQRPRHFGSFESFESLEGFPFTHRRFDSPEFHSFESLEGFPFTHRRFDSPEFHSFESHEFAPLRRVYG